MNDTCQAGCRWPLPLSLRPDGRDQSQGIPGTDGLLHGAGTGARCYRFPLRELSGGDGRTAALVQSRPLDHSDVVVCRRYATAGGRV